MVEKARLGEILIEAGEITPAELEAALAEQRDTGRPLGMTLVRMGALDEETLIRRLSRQLSLPMARLRGKRVSPEVAALVPADLAEKYHCVPLFLKDEAGSPVLYLGMEDATNLDAIDDVAAQVGMSVRPVLVATTEIDEALARRYADGAPAGPLDYADGAPAGTVPPPERRGEEPAEEAPLLPAADLDPFADSEPDFALGEAADGWDTGSEPDLDLDLDLGPLPEPDPIPDPEPAPAAPPGPVSQDAILRALSQLLVEKGLITRDELIERVRRESAAAGSRHS